MKKNTGSETIILMALQSESNGSIEQLGHLVYFTGIGKLNAAHSATKLIYETKCRRILNLGSAGSSGFKTHEIIECTGFVQRDMNLCPLGYEIGETPFDDIPHLIKVDSQVADLKKGVCGTGDNFAVGPGTLGSLNYDLVDMEAYAIAKVCKKMSIEFVSIKYITDGADHQAHNDWKENLARAAVGLVDVCLKNSHLFKT